MTPIDTTTISVTLPASFMRMACSTAISQNGFIAILTFAVSTALPSVLTLTLILGSTTRLIATSTFITTPQLGCCGQSREKPFILPDKGLPRNCRWTSIQTLMPLQPAAPAHCRIAYIRASRHEVCGRMHRLFHDDYSVTGNPGIEVTRESREGTRSIIDDVAPRVFLAEHEFNHGSDVATCRDD